MILSRKILVLENEGGSTVTTVGDEHVTWLAMTGAKSSESSFVVKQFDSHEYRLSCRQHCQLRLAARSNVLQESTLACIKANFEGILGNLMSHERDPSFSIPAGATPETTFISLVNGARSAMEDVLNKLVDELQTAGKEPEFEASVCISNDEYGAHLMVNKDMSLYMLALRTHSKLSLKQPIHIIVDESARKLIVIGLESTDKRGERYVHCHTFYGADIASEDFGTAFRNALVSAITRLIESAK